jgi:hypothetical protein
MTIEDYLSDLAVELQIRGATDHRIRDIVAEAETHLRESGEKPEEAFGNSKKYAEKMVCRDEHDSAPTDDPHWENRVFTATALDEMGILVWAGLEGWELIDVGALALFCRRPTDAKQIVRWEYKRRVGLHRVIIVEEMIKQEWEPCGNWLPFHYFKRRIKSR